jgi:hypothetical protein
LANVTLLEVATACPILTTTLPVVGFTVTPVPPFTLNTLLLTTPEVKLLVLLYKLVKLVVDTVPVSGLVSYKVVVLIWLLI